MRPSSALALAARALWIDIFRSFLGKSGLCPEQDEILPARVGGEGKVASGRTTMCMHKRNKFANYSDIMQEFVSSFPR